MHKRIGLALALASLAATMAAHAHNEEPAATGVAALAAGSASGPVSLTPEALAALRERVLQQCGLDRTANAGLPWYFHFEFGRQLLVAGDARRAAAHLVHAVALNPEPSDDKRMYGQWYVNYLPYVELATAQARLGNWPCAANALDLARAYGEPGKAAFDQVAYDRVQQQVTAHRDDDSACRKEDVLEPGYEADVSGG